MKCQETSIRWTCRRGRFVIAVVMLACAAQLPGQTVAAWTGPQDAVSPAASSQDPIQEDADQDLPGKGSPVSNATDQVDQAQQQVDSDPVQALNRRVQELEQKVEVMQKLLFRTARLDHRDAVRRYNEAQKILENSERLRIRGYITLAEVEQDRFNLEKARLELLLARSNTHMDELSVQIDLVDSRSRLQLAERQLIHKQQQFDTGLISKQELLLMRQDVDDAKRQVTFQQQRLKDVRQLMLESRQELAEGAKADSPSAKQTPASEPDGK